MIFDSIENIKLYCGLNPLIDRAFNYLIDTELSGLEEQSIDIQGEELYLMIQHYDTEPVFGRSYEAHNNYIDIQYVISGEETMICGNRKNLSIETEYNADTDCTLYHYNRDAADVKLNFGCGDFAVFYPVDAHIPKLQTGDTPSAVKKAVFKIRI